MRFLKNILLLTLLMFLASGCINQRNLDNAEHLRIGMTKAEVLDVMGEPVQDEIFTRPDVWFYQVETVWCDGLVTEDECMPVIFRDGKLVGFGKEYYGRIILRPTAPPIPVE